MLARLGHHREDLLDELDRDLRMKEVAHRINEDHPRSPPPQRLLKTARPEPQVKALLVGVARHAPPALGERFRVTVGAARRHLRAPGHRVPCRFRPLDRAAVCQGSDPMRMEYSLSTNVCSSGRRTVAPLDDSISEASPVRSAAAASSPTALGWPTGTPHSACRKPSSVFRRLEGSVQLSSEDG